MQTVNDVITDLNRQHEHSWVWAKGNFLSSVEALIIASGAKEVIEIGGGRRPSFSKEKVDELQLNYVSNDISAAELARAPEWVGQALFDVQTSDRALIEPFAEQFDFGFSRMVMEHVASYHRAYENIHMLLKNDGIAIALHPVLFTAPFVLNYLLPEAASRKLLAAIFPHRNKDQIPKFPAHYNGCFISETVRKKIKAIGFRDVWQVPFYGHEYYKKIPLLSSIHRITTNRIMDANFTPLATYSFTIVRK